MPPLRAIALSAFVLLGCTANDGPDAQPGGAPAANGARPFAVAEVASFEEPWAMAFLPNGALLVTERAGHLRYRLASGQVLDVAGVPAVDYGGQGGLGDVAIGPDYRQHGTIYLSWVEAGPNDTRGAVVGRGQLILTEDGARLDNLQVIWRQDPKRPGRGHFSHRIAFGPDGKLYITSGERQAFTPAQDPAANLGGVVRLNADGSVPADNPWAGRGGTGAQRWTMGNRNLLGLAFAPDGNLWEIEMGPKGGDEVNLIRPGLNYGWPNVSNGSHYDNDREHANHDIPDHAPGDGYEAPKVWWNPSISPSSLMIYSGGLFPQWRGDAFIGALSGEALIRVHLTGTEATKADQWDMGTRIREVEQGPDGAIYVLTDGDGAKLLRLTPAATR